MLPEPPAARDRRAVRDARGAAPGPHRPRDRPGARHRSDHGATRCAARLDPAADDLPDAARRAASRFFDGDASRASRAVPGAGNSRRSGCSARATSAPGSPASSGLPFSFAHHFMPRNTLPALEIYRRSFRPSATLDAPYAMVGVAVVCADTDEQARWLHGPREAVVPAPAQRAARARSRRPRRRPPTRTRRPSRRSSRAGRRPTSSARPRPSATGLRELQRAAPAADELMLTTMVYDHADRLRSYELRRPRARADGLARRMSVLDVLVWSDYI